MKKAYVTPELGVIGKFEDVTLATNSGTQTDSAYPAAPVNTLPPGSAALLSPLNVLS